MADESTEKSASSQPEDGVGRDEILNLNFVPNWARKPPSGGSYWASSDEDSSSSRRGGRGGSRQHERRQHDKRPRRDRPRPSRDRTYPERERGGERGSRPPRRDHAESYSAPRRSAREPVVAAPLTVRFLPEQKALSTLVRQVASSKRAYPLIDLAALLLSNPGWCFVKIESHSGDSEGLYQCKMCRSVGCTRESVESHFVAAHAAEFFRKEERDVEPPAGQFVCVAVCGMSGRFLGPPNHHSYAETVRQTHAASYASMSLDEYKSRIRTSHNQDDIEKWRQQLSKETVYFKSKGEDPEPLSWAAMSHLLKEELASKNVVHTLKASVPESVAKEIADASIKQAIRNAWQSESRFPLKVSFALRAAFRHRKLHVFKTGEGKGINFVTAIRPVPLNPEYAIESIHDVLTYLRDHPGCTRRQMVEELRPGAEKDSPAVEELIAPLHWLIDRGHIIEFFNGTLAVPLH